MSNPGTNGPGLLSNGGPGLLAGTLPGIPAKPQRLVEDRFAYDEVWVDGRPICLVGVISGHGGWQAASFVERELIPTLRALIVEEARHRPIGDAKSIQGLMATAFATIEVRLKNKVSDAVKLGFDRFVRIGASCCLVAVNDDHYVVANLGDVRAILCQRPIGSKTSGRNKSGCQGDGTPPMAGGFPSTSQSATAAPSRKAALLANPAVPAGPAEHPGAGEFYTIHREFPEPSDSETSETPNDPDEDLPEGDPDFGFQFFQVNPTTGLTPPQQLRKEYQERVLARLVAPSSVPKAEQKQSTGGPSSSVGGGTGATPSVITRANWKVLPLTEEQSASNPAERWRLQRARPDEEDLFTGGCAGEGGVDTKGAAWFLKGVLRPTGCFGHFALKDESLNISRSEIVPVAQEPQTCNDVLVPG